MWGLCFGNKHYNKKAQLSQIRCEEKTDAFKRFLVSLAIVVDSQL